MKMKRTLILFLAFAAISAFAGFLDFFGEKPPKYVFLFIGDGMATPQRMVAEEFARHAGHGELVINRMPFHATTRTGSASSLVTDSAASGTAIACGEKTINGRLGISADGKRNLVSSAEVAKETGKKIGIVTTVIINHATPAAFYAHRPSRAQLYAVGLDMIASGFDYFAGGGFGGHFDKKDDKEYRGNLYDLAENAGYKIIGTEEDFAALKPGCGKVFVRVTEKEMPFAIDTPADAKFTLAGLTAKGIELLDNPKGFFMMVEGGKIDYAGHSNDAATNLREVLAFDSAVKVAMEFAGKHPDETLIIVTGDHETGGMTMGFAATGYAMYMERLAFQKISVEKFNKKLAAAQKKNEDFSFEDAKKMLTEDFGFLFEKSENPMAVKDSELKILQNGFNAKKLGDAARRVMAAKAGIGWSSGAHTALPVLTTSSGKYAERFTGFFENTEISVRLKEILKK